MSHKAAFHQGLHCLLRQNRSSEKEIRFLFEITATCNPLNIQCTILTLMYQTLWKLSFVLKGNTFRRGLISILIVHLLRENRFIK